MAETGKKAVDSTATSPTVDPSPNVENHPSDTILEIPNENSKGKFLVKTAWPHSSFVVDGVPEIKAEGTRLNQTQLDKIKKAAGPSRVVLHIKEVE